MCANCPTSISRKYVSWTKSGPAKAGPAGPLATALDYSKRLGGERRRGSLDVKQYQVVRTRSLKDIVDVRIAYRCTCEQCEPMPSERESVCCREFQQVENKLMEWDGSSIDYITEHGGFQYVGVSYALCCRHVQ